MSTATEQTYGEVTAKGTIRFRRVLPGPIERVWAYITDSGKRGRWLASGDWDLEPGGKAELNFHHADLTPHEEEIPEKYKAFEGGVSYSCEVLRCDPPHLVSLLWKEDSGDSEVTFELSERDDGQILLVLTHSRLSDEGLREAGGGWHTHLRILDDRLHGREPAPFWADIVKFQADYARRLDQS